MSDKTKKGTESKTYKFDTLSLHAGYQPSKNAGSRQVPIYQTTSYLFDDVDHAAALFTRLRLEGPSSAAGGPAGGRSGHMSNLGVIWGVS